MEKIKVSVQERETDKTPNQLRREAKLPGTLYGPGQDPKSVQLDEKEFTRLPAAAYSHMIELDFGKGAPTNALIRHVQRKASTHKIMNVELYRVNLDKKLTVTVPLKFTGTSEAVVQGGQLVESALEAEIECLPGDIPDFIEVDLAKLKELEDAIHFSELTLPKNVLILNPHDEVVAKVIQPRVSNEPEEPTPAAAEPVPVAQAAPAAEG